MNTQNLKPITACLTVLLIGLIITGCGSSENTSPAVEVSLETPSVLEAVFKAVPVSQTIQSIPELRKGVQPGDNVVMEGKVMGATQVFVGQRALMVIGDEGTLTSCDLMPDDQCKTPWDNCCDDTELIRAGTATIQVVDEKGRVLKHGLEGVNGLGKLSRVRVSGTVAPMSSEAALIINATAIEIL